MQTAKVISSLFNALVLFGISAFHYYWAFGGKIGINAVLPQLENNGKKVFVPSKLITLIVAFLFLAIALFFSFQLDGLNLFSPLTNSVILYGLTGVFFIRAIGDFKYVGFFKKKSNTLFAINDTRYYSPLCLLVSLNCFVLVG
jgi:Protein of unknown function (DUF3995)